MHANTTPAIRVMGKNQAWYAIIIGSKYCCFPAGLFSEIQEFSIARIVHNTIQAVRNVYIFQR